MADSSGPIGAAPCPGPRGAKPKRALSGRNIMLYGILIVVCVYYLLTPLGDGDDLKGMPGSDGQHLLAPLEVTFRPGSSLVANFTGLNCDGLGRGFWNSVIITVCTLGDPVDHHRFGEQLRLINWKFKGSDIFFTV